LKPLELLEPGTPGTSVTWNPWDLELLKQPITPETLGTWNLQPGAKLYQKPAA